MYPWAANNTKLQSAIMKLKKLIPENGAPLTEENIKQQYILMGGLVLTEAKKPGRPKNATTTPVDL